MTDHSKNTQNLSRLVLTSLLLAIVVIGLGAYTRLTHAGLGCPDWPTCYGLLDVPQTSAQIAAAEQAFPQKPVEPAKAWNEMIHRYFAGSLGLLIAAIAFFSVKLRFSKRSTIRYPVILPLFILCVVIFQAALGMWTVTLKLMPIVVMGHLLGGFTTLCLLFLLYLRINAKGINAQGGNLVDWQLKKYSSYALLGISILTAQIALGGWTSSNYAAMSCVELPICQGDWLGNLTFEQSFDLIPPNKDSYEFGHLEHNERVTIHVSHRIGAIITGVFIAWLAIMVFLRARTHAIKSTALVLLSLLIVQISLGISNIWFSLPLKVAVAHNLVAACLMLSLITLAYKLRQNSEESFYE
ncbi:COX15/CtaA family protein [Colwellia psychrerythraea]|uniref:Cytochrome oxidase assembly n=1 Tax=Colwellia psychrerythraea TaxID=28229 RepID=A0A099L3B3_COLPS|nr:COX15/CtaA family protein [Colwellia psychrerythraea]KGJ97454.1 cytochrome oxidase assembly [Colwellia psychrerythraea]